MPEKWWTSFGDRELDRLVESTLTGNFSLKAAWDRLDQAAATARSQGAGIWPSVSGGIGFGETVTGQKLSPTQKGSTNFETFSLSLSASYEIDVWGRIAATRAAAGYDVAASREDISAAAMTLCAETVKAYFNLIEQRAQLRLYERQKDINRQYLDLVTIRFEQGMATTGEVLQQKQNLTRVTAEMERVATLAAIYESQLAVLAGTAPGAPSVATPDLFSPLPPFPATGVPLETVGRRPDVRAAFLRVKAAAGRRAAAAAERYPKLSITAGLSFTSKDIADLFSNWLVNLAANLLAPIFDGGRLQGEYERTEAVVRERVNTYGQTILTALKEVTDAIVRETRQSRYLELKRQELALARAATERVRDSHLAGAVDYTKVLDALKSEQSLESTVLTAERDLALYRVELYRTLGGGFELTRGADAAGADNE